MHIVYMVYDAGIDGGGPKNLIVATRSKDLADKMGASPYYNIETMPVYDDEKDYNTNRPEILLQNVLHKLKVADIEILKKHGLKA